MKKKEQKKETIFSDMEKKRDKIKSLLQDIDGNWFDLSLELYDTYSSKFYIAWGFESFRDFVELDLQLEYRIAMYRVKMAKAISLYEIEKEQVIDIGWTKFKELLPYLSENEKKNEKLFELARKLTVKELQAKLKKKSNAKKESIRLSFSFNPEQYELVEEALELGKETFGIEDKNRILEAIISEWLSMK